ncbi:MAG: two-component regulator propeller domain-containing protein [Anaerolineales bacterium]|nr:two-component regulator propeller domain-containing protein [Anaerolineales bacterium]
MRKTLAFWMLVLALLASSCGEAGSATEANPNLPAAAPTAQTNPSSPGSFSIPYGKNIRFEQISLDDGLSQSVVNIILQDHKGFLWIGTDDGLNRYDGYNFTIYKPDSSTAFGLSDRSITDLIEDEQGFLWVATRSGGLNRFDPGSGQFTHYLHDNLDDQTISSNQIHTLCLDETGLWIGTDNGLDFLDFETDQFTHYRASTEVPPDSRSLSSNSIRTLFKDSSGNLWIGTANSGVNIFNKTNDTFTIYKHNEKNPATLSNNRVLSITEGQKGEIWIGTANGLNRYNPTRKYFARFFTVRDTSRGLSGTTVYSLHMDRSGGLWAGTNEGLYRYDSQSGKFIHHQHQPGISNSLSNNQVYSIYEDASGVLWIGTYGGGLNKYNRQQDRFAYYRNDPNNPNSLGSNFIFPILADENGVVWIGTYGGGLSRFEPRTDQFTRYEHTPGSATTISSNNVISLYIDRKGILWAGTNHGLDRFDSVRKTFTQFQVIDPGTKEPVEVAVFAIREDSKGNFWVGTNRGLASFDQDTRVLTLLSGSDENIPASIGEHHINVIFEDRDKDLWIGTFDNGLKRLDLETGLVTHYRNNPDDTSTLGSNAIMSIHQDQRGTLWVGTHGGGLARYNPETNNFSHFTEKEGLPNNVIYGILEDATGDLWLSTNFGLSKFNPRNLAFRNFTASDGLQSNEFNQNAFAKDQNGTLYFGGINGLNVFQPQEIKDNPYPPNLALTALTHDGAPLEEMQTPEYLQSLMLPWPYDSFEFEFVAFAYEQPSKNQYAYMLEGFDTNWIQIGNQRTGRYTNLPGGTYTLRLRGSNSDNIWNEEGHAIEIVVVPPFWETWWFLGLMVIVLGVSAAGGIRWRVKRVENRNLELERLVQIRTADLEKRTSEIDALYQADEKILRSVTINQIFQALVDVSISMLRADRSSIFAWSEERGKILPIVCRGFQAETIAVLSFDQNEGQIGHAMKTGIPVIISKLDMAAQRKDIQTAMSNEGIESLAHFPIVVDGKVIALFNVAYTRPNALNEDAMRLFTTLVNRAAMSIANMDLFEQTKDLAVMEERNRLARDLHDSAKQKAFAALAQMGTVNGMIKSSPNGIKSHLSEAETLIYEVIQELNFLIQEIYPIALQEKGLQTTLREYVFEWESRNDAVANLTIQNERSLPLDIEQAVYRFVQEALANVSRHSKANRVGISLSYNTDSLQVNIGDNGIGFDVDKKAKGMGFRSMRERIGSIRGTVQIQSAPQQGTRLIAHIPIKSQAGEKNETSPHKHTNRR